MAVVASFTADVESGCGPLTVTFTDTSSGSPTNWMWDFGDGYTSDDQSPVHIYTINGTYTVILKVWDQISVSTINESLGTSTIKIGSSTDYNTAFANFLADSFSSGSFSSEGMYRVEKGAPGGSPFVFRSQRIDINFDLSSAGSGSILILNATYDNAVDNPDSEFLLNGSAQLTNPSGNILTPVFDVSDNFGESSFTVNALDINGNDFQILSPAPGGGFKTGWHISSMKVKNHAFNSKDIETKIDYISIGPPVADFSLDPPVGQSPVSVDFTNLSGSGFTYSWKRRVSGSGDAFVEFSTDENPTEIFDKLSP